MEQNGNIAQPRVNTAIVWTLCSVMLDKPHGLGYRIVHIEATAAFADLHAVVYFKLTPKTITELLKTCTDQHSGYNFHSWLKGYRYLISVLVEWWCCIHFGDMQEFWDTEEHGELPLNICNDVKLNVLGLLSSLGLYNK